MRKHKFELYRNRIYRRQEFEEHLQDLAKKGWIVEEVYGYVIHYKKQTAMDIKYNVVYLENNARSMSVEELMEIAALEGWELAASSKQMYIFKNKRLDASNLYDDELAAASYIRSTFFGLGQMTCLGISELILLALILPPEMQVRYTDLYSQTRLATLILMIVLIIHIGLFLYDGFRVRKQCDEVLEGSRILIDYQDILGRKIVIYSTIAIVVIAVLSIFYIEGWKQVVINLPAIVILGILVIPFELLSKKTKLNKKILTSLSMGVYAFGCMTLFSIQDTLEDTTVFSSPVSITLSDTYEPYNYTHKVKRSIFVKEHREGAAYSRNDNLKEDFWVEETYINCINEGFAQYIFEGIVKEKESYASIPYRAEMKHFMRNSDNFDTIDTKVEQTYHNALENRQEKTFEQAVLSLTKVDMEGVQGYYIEEDFVILKKGSQVITISCNVLEQSMIEQAVEKYFS